MGDHRIFYILRLHESCTQEAAEFIVKTLRDDAGLELYRTKHKNGGLILHITASDEKVWSIAESDLKLKKKDATGIMKDFERFGNYDNSEHCTKGIIGPLTLSDVQRCISYAMESVHFDKSLTVLPGQNRSLPIKNYPVLAAYREANLIESFPTHNEELLNELYSSWKTFKPPLNAIRNYFGENVALYFSFLSFYTIFLSTTSFLGVLQFILDYLFGVDYLYSNIIFAVLNLVTVSCFLEIWKRRSNDHAYDWASSGKLRHKKPRPEYRGVLKENPISGEMEIYYSSYKTFKKLMFVSIPLTSICLLLAFIFMLISFKADELFEIWFHDSEYAFIINNVPTILYSVLIMIFNRYYLHMAHYMTEWENHRTQEQFEKWVVYKLVIFESVNTFLSLFYITFVLGDLKVLKKQVFSMLLTSQIFTQTLETVLPICLKLPSSKKVMNRISTKKEDKCLHDGTELCSLLPEELGFVDLDFQKDPYESTYDDLMELWLQFGHVFFFSSLCPLAAILALGNNLLELKVNSFKLCRIARKPTPRANRDLGAWYDAFNLTVIISIMTNLALLSMDPDVQYFAGTKEYILIFVVFEHIFLAIKVLIDKAIPDVSGRVKFCLDRDEYYLRHKNL
ncbi:anoctamin-10 [Lepeophtheirus salmonis]|uniref:anoctamin-10 n=1 Tax=Lepeophtheirus salmonis TaxID=72036 RepID=UPI001AE0F29C|nr:anoctamin-10-like [Lepeophtheirus salmonis]